MRSNTRDSFGYNLNFLTLGSYDFRQIQVIKFNFMVWIYSKVTKLENSKVDVDHLIEFNDLNLSKVTKLKNSKLEDQFPIFVDHLI